MARRPTDQTTEALHELAAMYLTGGERHAAEDPADDVAPLGRIEPEPRADSDQPDSPASAPEPAPGPVEMVLVGHLPGPANLWLHQYAQRRAEEHHRQLLLARVELETIHCDRFTPMRPEPPAIPDSAAEDPAVRVVYPGQTDPKTQGQLAERLDQWTILSGADPAAVVAAYRLIKQWLDLRPGDTDSPAIRIMFLGCDGPAAQAAAERIQRTAGQFLSLPLRIVGAQQQMQPVRRRHLEALELSEAAIAQLCTRQPIGDQGSLGPERLSDQELSALHEVEADRADEPADATTPHDHAAATKDHAPTRDHAAGPALCEYLPHLTALAARHPRHEAIELAADANGRLHLLGFDHEPAAHESLALLVEVRAWAAEHVDLLARACPQLDAGAGEPRMHLFVNDPRAHQGLMRSAGGDVPDLHLLLAVTVGPTTTWTHVQLTG